MRLVSSLIAALCLSACGAAPSMPDPNAAELAQDRARFEAADDQHDVYMVEPAAERLPQFVKTDAEIDAHYERRSAQAKAVDRAYGTFFQGGPNPWLVDAEVKRARVWLRLAEEMRAVAEPAPADEVARLSFASRFIQPSVLNAGNALDRAQAHLTEHPAVKSKDVELEIMYGAACKQLNALKAAFKL